MILLEALLIGLLGLLVENIFTGVSSVVAGDRRATTHSYLWMLPVWAFAGLFLRLLAPEVHGWALPWRWLVYFSSIYWMEFLFGLAIKGLIGVVPWDYGDRPGSVAHGTINLAYAPFWGALALAVEPGLHFVARLAAALGHG